MVASSQVTPLCRVDKTNENTPQFLILVLLWTFFPTFVIGVVMTAYRLMGTHPTLSPEAHLCGLESLPVPGYMAWITASHPLDLGLLALSPSAP